MLKQQIIDYAKQCEPYEMCGFVVFDGQEKIFIACENIAEDKENHFEISADDFLKASEYDGIVALVHSHPKGEPLLSTMDRQTQMFSNLDFWLVCHDEIHEFPVIPYLLGRDFIHGEIDCYTLFRDFYRLAGVDFPNFERDDFWWEYVAEIRAKNEQGQLSEAVTKAFNISFAVSELTTVSKVFGILLQWKNPVFANPNSAIEIWTSTEERFETARKLVTLAYPTNSYSFDGLGVNETHYFWARMLDTANGNAGQFTESVVGVSESSGSKLVEYLKGQISSNAFSQELAEQITKIEKTGKSNAARINSMHILKVEDHASGKKAIAGIAIGADAENEESQVIISANKFVIADPNSRELKTPFLVSTQNGQSRVALDGDLIVSNSITGDKIQANTSITSPTIKGGQIDIGNGVFTVNPNGHITANSGVFKGRIEATDGFFGGTVYADKIVGDVLKFYSTLGKRVAGSNRVAKIVYDNIIIPAFSRERTVYLCPIMLVAAGKAGYHYSTGNDNDHYVGPIGASVTFKMMLNNTTIVDEEISTPDEKVVFRHLTKTFKIPADVTANISFESNQLLGELVLLVQGI